MALSSSKILVSKKTWPFAFQYTQIQQISHSILRIYIYWWIVRHTHWKMKPTCPEVTKHMLGERSSYAWRCMDTVQEGVLVADHRRVWYIYIYSTFIYIYTTLGYTSSPPSSMINIFSFNHQCNSIYSCSIYNWIVFITFFTEKKTNAF